MSLARKRIIFSFFIIIFYLIGRHIPLPLVDIATFQEQSEFANNSLLQVSSIVTGGNLSQLSIFSLGLGPWMSTMIIWGFLGMSSKLNIDKLPAKVADRRKKYLMLVITCIQSLGLINFLNVPFMETSLPRYVLIMILMSQLLTGCFVVMWLANLNTLFGIGNASLFILVGMIADWPNRIKFALDDDNLLMDHWWIYIVLAIICLILVRITLVLERAEYRMPIERVMIHNDFSHKTYIPLKLNISGGMSIVYGMTMMVFPQYLLSALHVFFPDSNIIRFLIENLQLYKPLGALLYLIILFSLTVGFSFVNVKPDEISRNLQQSGDYMIGKNPGKQTYSFLHEKVRAIGMIDGLFITTAVGVPLVIAILFDLHQTIATFPGMVLILTTLLFNILDQIDILRMANKYQDII
ncbi:accessory Sec system protein translocase subunit SecY2 [Streptococcus suis]|nr:accessory Sec system protein translocase subunit SecY2 [Streptococcus suis]NQP36928.1 accessory Sec system protein translocase subunit SecY2 [Streptococcus suis]